jgi:hypothetical protein
VTKDQYTQGLIVGYVTAAKLLREGCEDPEILENMAKELEQES